ncbi:MAG: asparagine synthase (glutamine-hydrolyzing) [Deltaproteobacteria bacterium]|nr:asparagine synthase (glutamine-hydrolyzing) [Deltaproteobacteria bacterium]
MCGIIGIASSTAATRRDWLVAGRDAMRHRGPDDQGEWWSDDGRVGLGHRRLSIIDLSPAGHQPMEDAQGALCIVFNGEIYNFTELRRELGPAGYPFRSQSDTEVILAAYREWDTDCLSHLSGMFAFALYDRAKRRILLARDRAGEKPLFYSLRRGTLTFASELKGLMADPELPRTVDPEALDCYLTLGFVPGDRCMLRDVRKLPPAHALAFELDGGASRVWPYWHLPAPPPPPTTTSDAALLDELEALLQDAVRRQLVADVPVGILLSGGVDSSLITAMAVRTSSKVKTFTIRFPGHGSYDETDHARLVARHFGTEHVELEAGESSADLLPLLARQFDEPMADSSMIPTYLVSRLVREHCTVAIGGDGGDELFAGYPRYDRLLWSEKWLGWIPGSLRRLAAGAAETLLPVGLKGRNRLQDLGVEPGRGLPVVPLVFDRNTRRRLLAGRDPWKLQAEHIWDDRIPPAADPLQRATRMDFANYLAEDILVKVDRASMLCSLEVRAPLLDRTVIEFAFGKVPSEWKASTTGRKLMLKRLARRVLPPEFDRHRKQGFSIPLAAWLSSGPWRNTFLEVLSQASDSPFDRKVGAELLDGAVRGRATSERLFALVLFEFWRREYRVAW